MRESQCKRMIKAMKRRKMTPMDFMRMGIMQYNARLWDIKQAGIEKIESRHILGEDGKLTRYKEHWIPEYRDEDNFYKDIKEDRKSTFFERRLKQIIGDK